MIATNIRSSDGASFSNTETAARARHRGGAAEALPSVSELLDVDHEYRQRATAGELPMIAPARFNPAGERWLPALHTTRGARHYTALFSNTAIAHQMRRTRDWVVIYFDGRDSERHCTVVTAFKGPLAGLRIVRGRESECIAHYRLNVASRRGSTWRTPRTSSGRRPLRRAADFF
jgi:hypothetical protein